MKNHRKGPEGLSAVHRKDLQLARRVERLLATVLAGECGDERLGALVVESVTPAPDAGHLLVRLGLPPDGPAAAELIPALAAVRPHLRRAVAEDLDRKRAPELTLVLVPAGLPGAEEEVEA